MGLSTDHDEELEEFNLMEMINEEDAATKLEITMITCLAFFALFD